MNNRAGDDHFDGRFDVGQGGANGPVQTFAKALRIADTGDRIIVANTGEPYRESVSLSGPKHSGFNFKPLVIDGNGATLDGSAPAEGWQPVGGDVLRFRPERMAFGMLFAKGIPLVRVPAGLPSAGVPALLPTQWTLREGWIYFRVEPDRLPEQYQLTYARLQVGLTLYKVEQVAITNLVVQGFELDGINCQDVRPTSRSITSLPAGTAAAESRFAARRMRRSTLVSSDGNGQSQLHIEGTSEVNATGCELIPKSAPNWLMHGGRLMIDGKRGSGAQ